MSLKAGVATLYALRPAAAFSIAACAKKPCACTQIGYGSHLPRRPTMPFTELTCVTDRLIAKSLQMPVDRRRSSTCSRLSTET